MTHALSGRFGTTFLVNGQTDLELAARQGERVRFFLVNTANTRTFAVNLEEHVLKLIGADGGRAAREVLTSSVVLAPSERAIADVLFQSAGSFRLQQQSPLRAVSLGTVRVKAASGGASPAEFFRPGGDEAVAREAAALLARAPAQPHYVLSLKLEGDPMAAMGGMMGMGDMTAPIEWEEDGHMGMMNQMSTSRTLRWVIRDRASGRQGMDIPLEAQAGQARLLRLVNESGAGHSMQHPIHLHGQLEGTDQSGVEGHGAGAGRFLLRRVGGIRKPGALAAALSHPRAHGGGHDGGVHGEGARLNRFTPVSVTSMPTTVPDAAANSRW